MPYRLSNRDKIDTFLGLCSVAAAALVYAAFLGPFRGQSGADTYHHHIIQAVVKKVYVRHTSTQGRIYQDFCHKRGIKPHFVSTDSGVEGFWIGDPSAKYVVVFFHGGGFAMDATKTYLDLWTRVQKELADAGIATAWFNSMYSLTPHAAYPVQFREAVETLRYVLENPRRSPAQVLIAGDSAGGSLCLAVLSHMLHRSDDVPELVLDGPLKAAILLSPWVSFSQDWPSVAHNKEKDIDAQEVTTRWSQLYLNGRASNNYIEAVDAPAEWWKGTQVEQVLVLAGADEVLIDPIKLWTSKFRKFNPNTTLVVGENECHVAPLIWPMFGDSHETEQERALKCWLLERLR
ncbi:hypothetical protein BDW75DRAFT_250734 [Aspergillus navahoensis]